MPLAPVVSTPLISEQTYNQLWPQDQRQNLQLTAVKLCTYNGEQLNVKDVITVEVQYNGQSELLPLIVANEQRPSLLGRDWLTWTGLNCAITMCVILSLQGIFADYSILFLTLNYVCRNSHGYYLSGSCSPTLLLQTKSSPLCFKGGDQKGTRTVSKTEKINFSEWAAPNVPVMKKDDLLRICGDYKITVNKASKTESYLVQKIDDLLASLAGGKKFSKLDLANAYQRIRTP